ncbi:Putative membrane protein [Corynebacterium glyciniphilum AJ 3170]|uniref:Putative membrane protein n=1 Tax=Corynebacterium glyciniphilum AJ 3170 TaxID=1404245 RepID=X5E8F6_9CORY|nr:hypothetical protein [Corynebacterium glyciniphilum]AHW63710.1 Putative membrane protein [Corynebacterium glyciniphilum AJ 3170]
MEQIQDWIISLQQYVDTLPGGLQLTAVFVIGLVPLLEGDVAALVGVLSGIHWLPTVIVGTVGTVLITVSAVGIAGTVGRRQEGRWKDHRVMRRVGSWGSPVAMLVSGLLFSVPITAFIMRASGIPRTVVLTSAVLVSAANALIVGLLVSGALSWLVDT